MKPMIFKSIKRIKVPKEFLNTRICKRRFKEIENSLSTEYPIGGTNNSKEIEIFGWLNPVHPHIDNSTMNGHYNYIMVLDTKPKLVELGIHIDKNNYSINYLFPNVIYRFNERHRHFTLGEDITFTLFCGCFEKPCDKDVVKKFQNFINSKLGI